MGMSQADDEIMAYFEMQQARERMLSAALNLVSARIYRGVHSSQDQELAEQYDNDVLDECIAEYIIKRNGVKG